MSKETTSPRAIDWSNKKITAEEIERHSSDLRMAHHINLESCQLDIHAALMLAKVLEQSFCLTKINLNNNPDIGRIGIQALLKEMSYCRNLEILLLRNTGYYGVAPNLYTADNRSTAQTMASEVQRNILGSLRCLYGLERHINQIDRLGNTKKFLYFDIEAESFSLQNERDTPHKRALTGIIEQARKIKETFDALKEGNCEEINLSDCNIRNAHIEYMLKITLDKKSLPVKKMILSNNKFDSYSVGNLNLLLQKCPQLEYLDISGNLISRREIQSLISNLNPSLKHLDLSGTGIDDKTLIPVFNHLRNLNKLSELRFRQNEISLKTTKLIADELKPNKAFSKLKTLDLSSNRLSAKGVKHLCDALEENTNLNYFFIDNNHIKDAGAQHVANLIKKNSHIFQIGVELNDISEKGLKGLVKALENNYQVCVINTKANQFSHETVSEKKSIKKQFFDELERNKKMKTHYEATDNALTKDDYIEKMIGEIKGYLSKRKSETRRIGIFGYSKKDYAKRQESFDKIWRELSNPESTKERLIDLLNKENKKFKSGVSHRYFDLLSKLKGMLQTDWVKLTHSSSKETIDRTGAEDRINLR